MPLLHTSEPPAQIARGSTHTPELPGHSSSVGKLAKEEVHGTVRTGIGTDWAHVEGGLEVLRSQRDVSQLQQPQGYLLGGWIANRYCQDRRNYLSIAALDMKVVSLC